MQVADFGVALGAYAVNMYQLSVLYGRGQGAKGTVYL